MGAYDSNHASLESNILALVQRPGYRPIKPRVIAQQLGISKEDVAAVKRIIKSLVRRGELVYGNGHLVELADPSKPKGNRIVGIFRQNAKGFGFVRPRIPSAGNLEIEDLYIPAKWTSDAASGDLVMVALSKGRTDHRRPGPRGEIVEILQRETHQFVGTYFKSSGSAFVEVDGNVFAQPIYVGDPGSKNAVEDDKVVFEMVRFPSQFHDGEGAITEVLGQRGEPGVDTMSIIREFNLPETFSEKALDEARKVADEFDESIPESRLDLTEKTIVTIDPADARDFDDAISLEEMECGHLLLGVHIADVSHFVRPKTDLDREAYERGTSVYLPDRVIPMLPEIISNSLASLQPNKVRYTKTVLLEFTPDGICVGKEFHSAAIKSSKRLNYEQVDKFLDNPATWQEKLDVPVFELLGRMHKLAMILRERRMASGALEMTMPEIRIKLDKFGRVSGANVSQNTESHQIIEEFMLAANESIAEMLAERELHFLRRTHAAPKPRKLKALTEFVNELGLNTESLQDRFELQKLLKKVVGMPEEYAVNYAMLRAMQRAVYEPKEEGHYALASKCYCHFTSPIRRYPDLTIHRVIGEILAGRKPVGNFADLTTIGELCSNREQRAALAERELVKLKLLDYLSDRIGEEMDAVATGVERFGLYVQGIELPAEGLIHVDSLTDDFYSYDRNTHTLTGRRSNNCYRLGDVLRVQVARVDMERRELDFRLVSIKRGKPNQPTKNIKRKGPRAKEFSKEKKVRGKKTKYRRKL